MKLSAKHLKIHIKIYLLFGAITLLITLIVGNLYSEQIDLKAPTTIGISFSPAYATSLGLNPKEVFIKALDELHIKALRLNAYWDEIEGIQNKYDFLDLDYYINEASKRNVKIYLAVGYKLPRWPECHPPKWLKGQSDDFRKENQLKYVATVVNRYNDNPAIKAFQIENEPLFDFGICPPVDADYLRKEVAFIRTITKKPIILTDSGELNTWVTPMQLSDIFGTTVYRIVDTPVLGVSHYPLQPWFYRVKSEVIRKLFAPKNQKTVVIELQAEAWSNKSLIETPIEEQTNNYTLEQFRQTLTFAKRTGFDEIYLWGVEWWYFLASKGHLEYINIAKQIL